MDTDLHVLCMVAHPDDAEIMAGGTLIKLVDQGYRVGIIDFTCGEMSTRGTPQEREQEAACAAKVMGVQVRENLHFPDAFVESTVANRRPVIEAIRRYRPRLIITSDLNTRNPDHSHVARLVRESAFNAGLVKYDTGKKRHRPDKILYAMEYFEAEPSFAVNIAARWERKMQALACHQSQLFNPGYQGENTYISSNQFIRDIESRFRYWGAKIHCDYAEVFRIETLLEIEDVVKEVALRGIIPGQE